MANAPNISNLTIPKGVVSFTPQGGSKTDLGECSTFVYTADVTKKDFWSARSGIRTKAISVVTQVGATVKMTLHEINQFNMALYVLGDSNTTGTLGGLSETNKQGVLEFAGANDQGSLVTFTCSCTLLPAGDTSLMTDSDDWMGLPINAEVQKNNNVYGEWTVEDQPTA